MFSKCKYFLLRTRACGRGSFGGPVEGIVLGRFMLLPCQCQIRFTTFAAPPTSTARRLSSHLGAGSNAAGGRTVEALARDHRQGGDECGCRIGAGGGRALARRWPGTG